jgi:uncharacterized protein YhfF
VKEEEIWLKYSQAKTDAKSYSAWSFCGGGDVGDNLAELVINGTKTATASAYQIYENEGSPIPAVGDLSIILKTNGQAVCIIRTSNVRICRFSDVTSEHAYNEGEGDRSLEYWREVHKEYFSQELDRIGREFDEEMLVVCESFELEFK